ncbi:hypothetical protein EZV62_002497 [Acer yangbiense]|uniref:Uncharacterized protein n=1 Tax=Acer yangbiense TaxID=1000413 RepID=A0A5C7IXP6_9ROSI|nr:hypothetical protein EZV62_002497 [Acer yangbiense]
MVEVVISIAAKVAELMVVPVGKHICYPFKYNSNMDELKKQVEKLKGVREMLQHSVNEAKTQGDEIEKVVEKWLSKVDEFTEGVVKPIIDDQDKAGKLCSIGFCPNLMARYSLSKKAAKTTKDGLDLLGDGKFDKVSFRPLLRKTISTYIRGYEDFESRTPIFQEIMQALRDDNFKMIGVYGMGGVGKTTLVQRVVGQAIKEKLFDFENIVDITRTPDIKEIQAQIAEELGLNLHEESLSRRAVRLRDRLKKEEKVLIVLDNIWAKLDLEAVGIPFGHEEEKGRNDDQRRCKILLTSRSEYVLRNDMNAEKNFLVEILSEEEAGNLFWKIVGDAAKNCDFEAIGVEIIRCCAGLPVAIATIASALKEKSLFDWKDALDQLRRSNPRYIKGMDAKVYSALKLSYDFLESEEAKSLFLLCSLENASSNISFDYLLRYCMGLGLFQNVSTLEQGRNRLHSLINHLKASCLLLDGNTNRCVKMHDIIHAVAVSIASTDKLMFNIQDVTDLKEMLEEKLPKDSTAISLFHKDVSMLPERLAYPKLKLFFLVMEEFSLQIPDTFFEGMEELKVLDTTKIHMLSLPSSLSKLTNLQTLCLDQCQLRNVAIIGELKRLEILCFWGSDIEQLPTQIGRLTRLRLLELSNCSNLKVISPNVISSLTRLEELYMGNSFIQWEVEGQSNASLSELKQLSRLTTLEIHVLDAQIMPQDLMIFEKLERYKIIIGDAWEPKWSHNYEASRALKLKLNNSIYLRNEIKILLSNTEVLYLDELKGVKNVIYQLDGEGFPQLKHLHVQNGSEIQYIVNSIGQGQCNVFPMLQSLFLHNLINLEKICHGQLATKSFNKLKIMKIGRCDGLNHLFSFSIAKNLMQLQEIEVTYCKKLEEIVFKESHEQFQQNDSVSKIEFTQLRRLRLKHLPKLTSFCNFEGKSIELLSLDSLWLENCPKMQAFVSNSPHANIPTNKEEQVNSEQSLHANIQPLFDEKVRIPNVKDLRIKEMNMKKIWHHDQLTSDSFSKIDSFGVYDCHNLLNIFPSNMRGRLQKIETLAIERCNSLEEIFEELKISSCMMEEIVAKEDLEAVPRFAFPQLQWLQLVDLPSLRSFYSGVYISEWPKLKKLKMWGCNKVEILTSEFLNLQKSHGKSQLENSIQEPLFIVDKVAFPEVEILTLEWNWIVKEILHGKFLEYSCNLKVLQLLSARVDCKEKHVEAPSKLNYLSLVGMKDSSLVWEENSLPSKVFQNLTTLEVKSCYNLKTLVPSFVCFRNLATLEVSNCNGLVNLLAVSVAKSLVQLTRLKITRCKIIEKIVTHGLQVDEMEDMIIFNQLKYLELHCLPRLTSFSSENYVFKFPSLQQLVVGQCQSMRIFSQGALSTPRLHKLQITEADEEGIWKESLEVYYCHNVLIVFPSNMLGRLQKLDTLLLRNCSSPYEIFEPQATGCGKTQAIKATQLRKLELNDLPKLKHVWNMDSQENCCMVEEIFAKEEEVNEVGPRFPQLTFLRLAKLSRLQSFYPMVHILEWPMLKRLHVWNCDKAVSKFLSFQVTDGESEHEMPMGQPLLLLDKVPLTNLERLGLDWKWIEKEALHEKLPEFSCKLNALTFNGFHKGADICVFCFLNKLPNLQALQVNDGFFKEVFLS